MSAGLAALLWAAPSGAQAAGPRNVIEQLHEALSRDGGESEAARTALEQAVRQRFADYAIQIPKPSAMGSLLHAVAEGQLDGASDARIAEVAFAAYQAVQRGSPPEVVDGIALYGYRKSIAADTLSAWANGYQLAVARGVPAPVAAELVRAAMEHGWEVRTFDVAKWALADAAAHRHDVRVYATQLLSRIEKNPAHAGRAAGEVAQLFAQARRGHRSVPAAPYRGAFALQAAETQEPLPEKVEPAPQGEKAGTTAGEPSPERREEPAESARHKRRPPKATGRWAQLWPQLSHEVRSFLGTPYVWGGESHQGVDCSGLTQLSYRAIEVPIPRVARQQWASGAAAPQLREGDLVFFDTLGSGVSHVGMVVDAQEGRFIHASSSRGVMESRLSQGYFRKRLLGARRMVAAQ